MHRERQKQWYGEVQEKVVHKTSEDEIRRSIENLEPRSTDRGSTDKCRTEC